jgi:salicylate hydroxylase
MSTASKLRVAVLGGGPAGLTTALALERYAPNTVDVTLFDRNATETDYPGVEYGIQERACRALDRIGVKDAALRRGLANREIVFRIVRTSRIQGRIRTDPRWCFCVVRQEFLADLAGLLSSTTLRRSTVVEHVEPAGGGRVRLSVGRTDSKLTSAEVYDCVVAADGVHSQVRREVFSQSAQIHDRGFSCLYLLVDGRGAASLPDYFQTLANEGRSELILGNESTWTAFPLGHDRLALGVGFSHQVRERLWRERGLAPDLEWRAIQADDKRAIALRLAADAPVFDHLFTRLLTDFVPDWNSYKIYLWPMKDSDPLSSPYLEATNLVVIGDAAHAFLPTIGMGASLAIEDAEYLASLVAKVAEKCRDPETARGALRAEAFVPFAKSRVPVWNDLMHRARMAAQKNFLDQGRRRRFWLAPQVPGRIAFRVVAEAERMLERIGL